MRILDTSALDYAAKTGIVLAGDFFITPDVLDEFEIGHDRRPPKNIKNVFELDGFNRATYLRSYQNMLNAYGGRSFYNMTGFGDISILALVQTQKEEAARVLPGLSEAVHIVSGDGGLTKKLRREFCDKSDSFSKLVHIHRPQDYFKA